MAAFRHRGIIKCCSSNGGSTFHTSTVSSARFRGIILVCIEANVDLDSWLCLPSSKVMILTRVIEASFLVAQAATSITPDSSAKV